MVFDRKYNFYCFKRPDIKLMKQAATQFIGTHDFKAFSDNKRMKKSTVRTISSIDIYGDEKEITVTIKGSYSDKGFRRFCLFLLYHESCGLLVP